MRGVSILLVVSAVVLTPGVAVSEEDFRYSGAVFAASAAAGGEEPERAARCDYLLRGEPSAGWLGDVIVIPAGYADGVHRFVLADGRMSATDGLPLSDSIDFDVTFARDLGTCTGPLEGATRFGSIGNEQGVVPAGSRYAIVTMRTVQRPNSAFELTIAAGA